MKQCLAQRADIEKLITATESERESAFASVEKARAGLDEQEAEFALSGGTGHTEGSSAMIDAAVRVEALDARLRGLRNRLFDNGDEVLRLESEFNQARKEFNRQRISELLPEYLKAATAFAAVNRKLCALAEALKDSQAIDAAYNAAAFNPLTGEFLLEELDPSNYVVGWQYQCWRPDWKSDSKATALFEANTGPAAIADQVKDLVYKVRDDNQRRRYQQQAEIAANKKKATTERLAAGGVIVHGFDANGNPELQVHKTA